MLLEDKVAIITGAASARGLGFATAKLFADNGAKVVIIDLNGEASKTAAAVSSAARTTARQKPGCWVWRGRWRASLARITSALTASPRG